jgi:malonyl CoA-acyl carrier protein transacylase
MKAYLIGLGFSGRHGGSVQGLARAAFCGHASQPGHGSRDAAWHEALRYAGLRPEQVMVHDGEDQGHGLESTYSWHAALDALEDHPYTAAMIGRAGHWLCMILAQEPVQGRVWVSLELHREPPSDFHAWERLAMGKVDLLAIPPEAGPALRSLLPAFDPAEDMVCGAGLELGFGDLDAFITAVLAIVHRALPPAEVGFATLFHGTQLACHATVQPWIHHPSFGPRRALACWFGHEGHSMTTLVVLSEGDRMDMLPLPRGSELFVLSSGDVPAMLEALGELHRTIIRQEDSSLSALALETQQRFDWGLPCRLAVVAMDSEGLLQQLQIATQLIASGEARLVDRDGLYWHHQGNMRPGRTVFLFPGQGFPGLMGQFAIHLGELALRLAVVREVLDRADRRDEHPNDHVSLSQMLFPFGYAPQEIQQRRRNRLASPMIADEQRCLERLDRKCSMLGLTVANLACFRALQQLGIHYDAVFGQSLGEMAALCAAGVLSSDEVVHLLRSEPDFDTSYYGIGRMFAVAAPLEVVEKVLQAYPGVAIAVYIAPAFHLVAGVREEAERAMEMLRTQGHWVQPLPYPAIHTERMTGLYEAAKPLFEKLTIHAPHCLIYSGTTAAPYPAEPEAARQAMMANYNHPVLLWQTQKRLYDDGFRVLIQAGGGSTMYAQARTNLDADDVVASSVDTEYRDPLLQLHHLLAALITHGHEVRLDALWAGLEAHLAATAASSAEGLPDTVHISLSEVYDGESRVDAGPDDLVVQSDILRAHEGGTGLDDGPPVDLMPFVGQILHLDDTRLIMERVLDLNEDWHLADHVFVPARGIKPLWACMPVMPITMTLEAMAEAASLLAPGLGLLAIENVEARRWVALEETSQLSLRFEASLVEQDVTGCLVACSVFAGEAEQAATSALLRFGSHYEQTCTVDLEGLGEPRAYDMTPQEAYESGYLFHGPLYQTIRDIPAIMERGIVGIIEVGHINRLFASTSTPVLATDPVFLDAIGQLLGLWAIPQKKYIFPLHIDKIEFYGPTPAPGTRATVWIRTVQQRYHAVAADMEVLDDQGQVWFRVKGWQDWVFRWPPNYYGIRRRPTKYLLGDVLSLPLEELRAVRVADISTLPAADQAFLARVYLTVQEWREYHALGDQQRLEWFMQRLAAKDAARSYLARQGASSYVHPAALTVLRAQGKPVVGSDGLLSVLHEGQRLHVATAALPDGSMMGAAAGMPLALLVWADPTERLPLDDMARAVAGRLWGMSSDPTWSVSQMGASQWVVSGYGQALVVAMAMGEVLCMLAHPAQPETSTRPILEVSR